MPLAEIKSERERTKMNRDIPTQSTGRKGELCLLTTGGLISVRRFSPHMELHVTDQPVLHVGIECEHFDDLLALGPHVIPLRHWALEAY